MRPSQCLDIGAYRRPPGWRSKAREPPGITGTTSVFERGPRQMSARVTSLLGPRTAALSPPSRRPRAYLHGGSRGRGSGEPHALEERSGWTRRGIVGVRDAGRRRRGRSSYFICQSLPPPVLRPIFFYFFCPLMRHRKYGTLRKRGVLNF
jgi:hypothetical protein